MNQRKIPPSNSMKERIPNMLVLDPKQVPIREYLAGSSLTLLERLLRRQKRFIDVRYSLLTSIGSSIKTR